MLGSSTDLLNPQCAYSTWSSITFLWRSHWTILSSKSIFLPGLSGLLTVTESQAVKCSSGAVRRTPLNLFSLCRAQVWSVTQIKPLAAGIARLGQLCGLLCREGKDCWGHQWSTAVTDSTTQDHTCKPPSHCHFLTGHCTPVQESWCFQCGVEMQHILLFQIWFRAYAARCNLHRLVSAWTPVLDFLV